MLNRRLLSSVSSAPVCRDAGRGFDRESRPDHHLELKITEDKGQMFRHETCDMRAI